MFNNYFVEKKEDKSVITLNGIVSKEFVNKYEEKDAVDFNYSYTSSGFFTVIEVSGKTDKEIQSLTDKISKTEDLFLDETSEFTFKIVS